MSVHASKFYEELILEQTQLMEKLKMGNDDKANTQALNVINSLIKYIYKYNQYQNSKLQTIDMKTKPEKQSKNKVAF